MPSLSAKPTSVVQIMLDIMGAIKKSELIAALISTKHVSYGVGGNYEETVMGDLAPNQTSFHIAQREETDIGTFAVGRQIPLVLEIGLCGDGEKVTDGITLTDGMMDAEQLIFAIRETVAETYVGADAGQFSYLIDATEAPIIRATINLTITIS